MARTRLKFGPKTQNLLTILWWYVLRRRYQLYTWCGCFLGLLELLAVSFFLYCYIRSIKLGIIWPDLD
jgi:hypothetical protein